MKPKVYDVIVVGSGPGGGTAAYFLVKEGYSVLVLEKEKLPRYKTCGGGVSFHFLSKIFPFSFADVCEVQVNAMTYIYGRHEVTIPIVPGGVTMVMRSKLDQLILAQSHAEVLDGKTVIKVHENDQNVMIETADGDRFCGRYVIGADGANSVVAREIGLRRSKELVGAIELEVPVSPAMMAAYGKRIVFIFREISNGYIWIFPKADHLSVGIAGLHPKRGELQSTLSRVIKSHGISLENVPKHGHPIPIYTHREPVATKRVLLVGDAAGLVDPFSGEGIRYAIKSGRLAAQVILNADVLHYQKRIDREIGFSHSLSMMEARFFYSLERYCLRLGAPNPFTTQAIVDLLDDRVTTIAVLLRAIATLPVFVATEIMANIAGKLSGPERSNQIRAAIYPGYRL